MSWEEQGRQEHGWFGNGTTAKTEKEASMLAGGDLFGPAGLGQRMKAVIHGATGALPASLRKHVEAQPNGVALERLTRLMTVWGLSAHLDRASFADHFYGRPANDPAVAKLHDAVRIASLAQSHAELREAASDLAAAQQMIGLDRWSAFLKDAAQRASDPATIGAVEKSKRLLEPGIDAIMPVYPLETAIGIGAAGMVRGVGATARAVGGTILRQILPSRARLNGERLPNASKARIPPDKIMEYALNPAHSSGASKARVFESVLGFNRSNAAGLISQIKNGVMKYPALLRKTDGHGQHFAVDIPMTGPKGSAVVRTGWIIDPGGTTPRLTTIFVK